MEEKKRAGNGYLRENLCYIFISWKAIIFRYNKRHEEELFERNGVETDFPKWNVM